jgi:outer membrane protein OmpA-like peptidoglycan-associated protein
MKQFLRMPLLLLLCAMPFAGFAADQAKQAVPPGTLSGAQQAFDAATAAGAATAATTLYEDANVRLRFADANWNATKENDRYVARLRAEEAYYAARAAEAKARWLGQVTTGRNLQSDISRFGGKSDLVIQDEPSSVTIDRGSATADKINVAQAALDQAKTAGVGQIQDSDLATAEADLKTAKTINRAQKHSDSADHLAYVAEMIGRRGYYRARLAEVSRSIPSLQLERTRLAQAASEAQAVAERQQRQQAEKQAADLRHQLDEESANRQAQQAELDRLRAQIDENRRLMQTRMDQDRTARVDAERQLDQAFTRYEQTIPTGTPADVDAARRKVEDQQIALRSIQERERLNEQAMAAEIEGLRNDLERQRSSGKVNADVLAQRQQELAQRQADLDLVRQERDAAIRARTTADKVAQEAIAHALQRRQEVEAQATQLKQQVAQAQQQAQQAQAQAQQQVQQAQAQAQQQVAQAQQQAQQAQAELERTRSEMQRREMQEALAKIAATRTSERGLIVTLPGIFFDTGKTSLKTGAKSTLDKIAAQIKNNDRVRVSVEGHTDSVGSKEKNQALSEKRAAAVKDYLVVAGVPAGRITSLGKGDSEPVATNKSAAGRQQNRRVELVITQ